MYVYLEKNRNAYHKGQLTPFFIAILSILIIAIMISVNIGKVSLIKTHTSNSADAGALAAASLMANVFSMWSVQAVMMYASYDAESYAVEGLLKEAKQIIRNIRWQLGPMVIAFAAAAALTLIPVVGAALCLILMNATCLVFLSVGVSYSNLRKVMSGVKEKVKNLYETQKEQYEKIRDSTEEAIDGARAAGLRLAFANSNISSKLKDSQQEEYEDFLDNLKDSSELSQGVRSATYSWTDGQEREHRVDASVEIGDVQYYELIKTKKNKDKILKTYFVYWLILYWIQALAIGFASGQCPLTKIVSSLTNLADLNSAIGGLKETLQGMGDAGGGLEVTKLTENSLDKLENAKGAITEECASKSILLGIISGVVFGLSFVFNPVLKAIKKGIQEEEEPFQNSDGDTGDKILVTVEDIKLKDTDPPQSLKTSSTQRHEGINLGLWNMHYPKITSRAKADFSGGDISGQCVKDCQAFEPKLIESE